MNSMPLSNETLGKLGPKTSVLCGLPCRCRGLNCAHEFGKRNGVQQAGGPAGARSLELRSHPSRFVRCDCVFMARSPGAKLAGCFWNRDCLFLFAADKLCAAARTPPRNPSTPGPPQLLAWVSHGLF